MLLLSILLLALCPSLSLALPQSWHSLQGRESIPITNHTINPSLVTQFPNNTWLENFSVRPNGQLIITLLSEPSIYLVDPFSPEDHILLATIPGYIGLLGIVEFLPDEYYFVAGNLTGGITQPGSYGIWRLDMRSLTTRPAVSKVVDLPEASLLNGMEILDKETGLILIADSGLGVVWKLDVWTGEYEVFIDVPEMKIAANATLQLGVNGIHIRAGFLYFTSMSQELFCRIPLLDGYEIGDVEVLATGVFGDDFTLDKKGNAWITQDPMDQLTLVVGEGKAKGQVYTIAGALDTETVAGATMCAFGRLEGDKHVLYVVTNGGLANPVTGVGVVGGKVLGFDTAGYLAEILG